MQSSVENGLELLPRQTRLKDITLLRNVAANDPNVTLRVQIDFILVWFVFRECVVTVLRQKKNAFKLGCY